MSSNEPPPTNMSHMPITPKHATLIDQALQLVAARIEELGPAIGYTAIRPLTLEHMRQHTLAQTLRVIARYAEGYDLGKGEILTHIASVGRMLYPTPMSTSGYKFPPDFHKTPLGEMMHEALVRQFPREQRVNVTEAREILGVTRQTLHDWAANYSPIAPIYDHGQLTFLRHSVLKLQQERTKTQE
jgi:hypothetical protein